MMERFISRVHSNLQAGGGTMSIWTDPLPERDIYPDETWPDAGIDVMPVYDGIDVPAYEGFDDIPPRHIPLFHDGEAID